MLFENKKNIWKKWDKIIGTVLVTGLFLFFFFHPSFYIVNNGEVKVLRILFIAAGAGIGFGTVWVKNRLSQKWKTGISCCFFLATPLFCFFSLEYANIMEKRILWKVIVVLGKKKSLLSVAALAVLALVFLAVTNSYLWSSVLTGMVSCIFGVANYFVYTLRGIPLLASDLSIAGTALNVAGQYEYRLNYPTFVLIFLTVIWCMLLRWWGNERAIRGKKRWFFIALVTILLGIFVKLYMYTDLLKNCRVTVNTCNPHKSYKKHGAILTFLKSAQLTIVEKPEDYSLELVQEIAGRYPGVRQEGNTPNVIIIMDEAFSDMQAVAEFETSQEVIPFYQSLKENVIKGKMYVSSFGGKTANTEFEVLTGDSIGFLPPSATPYQIFIKDELPNLTTDLESQGYENTIGMHPFKSSSYNRQKVYEYLGFDTRIFGDEFSNAEKLRGYVTDAADFSAVIEEYEKARMAGDAPFFIHNVTMQNHSPYLDSKEELSEWITAEEGYDFEELEIFLTLVNKSDQALEQLIGYFTEVEDPTVILFFGDHQPGLSNKVYKKLLGKATEELTDEELMQKYFAPYLIWANFDIEEKKMDISSNYLVSIMKEAVGIRLTGYNQFLLELQKQLPVLSLNGYWDTKGDFYKIEDESSPYYQILQEYNILQYNHMFDKSNRLQNFFG